MSDVGNQVCVCEPGYITEFVRNVWHMRALFFLAHKKLPGTRLTHPLPSGAMHPLDNSQITQWGGITI